MVQDNQLRIKKNGKVEDDRVVPLEAEDDKASAALLLALLQELQDNEEVYEAELSHSLDEVRHYLTEVKEAIDKPNAQTSASTESVVDGTEQKPLSADELMKKVSSQNVTKYRPITKASSDSSDSGDTKDIVDGGNDDKNKADNNTVEKKENE